ncbi:hypothetical protein DM01DRAFT_1332652 [Hesseltinella vesiculosa]|uniref:Uncharacterized protein n=1 Tax=Hesseltinella vesiculosa TaxID=101127 RepID=A0A1X2GSS0_9FUNG|nr:hypothetical protein DM01DRAFT_1332652 [Hesseltinella vesiculosa]
MESEVNHNSWIHKRALEEEIAYEYDGFDHIGILVGCVFGVMVLLTIAIVTMILWRRRRRFYRLTTPPTFETSPASTALKSHPAASPFADSEKGMPVDTVMAAPAGHDAAESHSATAADSRNNGIMSSAVIMEEDEVELEESISRSDTSAMSVLHFPHPAVTIVTSSSVYFDPSEPMPSVSLERPVNRNSRFQEFF